jgi:peptidoglycan hydrolase-like protein with peptidoglycan-binding domain
MHGSTPSPTPEHVDHEVHSRWDLRVLVALLVGVLTVGVVMVVTDDDSGVPDAEAASLVASEAQADASIAGDPTVDAAVAADDPADTTATAVDPAVDVDAAVPVDPATGAATATTAEPSVELDGCTMQVTKVKVGDTGASVECVQKALTAAGFYAGAISGTFDDVTDTAARSFQSTNDLEVDGIVGGRTATSLGIWPGDESFVIRTPPPPAGAMDSTGYTLSSVATTGSDAPAMPADSGQGTGKRIVYDRAGQRVWAVDDDENVVRSYLVTGSQYNNETPGVHKVYSKSEVSTAWNGEAKLPLMVRYLDTVRGAIGFHGIPTHISDGSAYQTDAELGQKLSGGCQRQSNLDAAFMWNFADIGTTVIVT